MSNIYNKLEQMREILSDTEMESESKNCIVSIIDDIERELDIIDSAYEYLSENEDFN